jgi:uncharacterized OB-fold protein
MFPGRARDMLLAMNSRPIAANLFTAGASPRLLGGRHRDTGSIAFPLPADAESYETIELPNRGQLWSYTVQRFAPKPPFRGAEKFEPFALGYVELPGAIIVESRLADIPFDQLRIGLPVELAIVPLYTDADGTAVMSYAFRPDRQALS